MNVCNSWPEFNIVLPFTLRYFVGIDSNNEFQLAGIPFFGTLVAREGASIAWNEPNLHRFA